MGKRKSVHTKPTESTDDQCPIWIFQYIDREGKFAFDTSRKDFQHNLFWTKMIEYSRMTWGTIKTQTHDAGKSKHHRLDYDEKILTRDAMKCIERKIKPENRDAIFSFALNNLVRIIGIRVGAEFRVMWYDPNHEFSKSIKKHT